MLEPWIIEDDAKQNDRPQEQPQIQIELPLPPPDWRPNKKEEPHKNGVIIIPFYDDEE